MNTVRIEKTMINLLKPGHPRKEMFAELQSECDEKHPIYSLTYEGYQSPWKEVA